MIAGIGNVYRAELLHRARLDPFTPGHDIDDDTFWRLWQDTVDLMTIGLGAGWIVTDVQQVAAARLALVRGEQVPHWPKRYAVYGRAGKPCQVCGTTVLAERVGLQRLFWCPVCQHAGPPRPGAVEPWLRTPQDSRYRSCQPAVRSSATSSMVGGSRQGRPLARRTARHSSRRV